LDHCIFLESDHGHGTLIANFGARVTAGEYYERLTRCGGPTGGTAGIVVPVIRVGYVRYRMDALAPDCDSACPIDAGGSLVIDRHNTLGALNSVRRVANG